MTSWHYFDPMPVAGYGNFPSWCDATQVPVYNSGYTSGNQWCRNQALNDRQSRPGCNTMARNFEISQTKQGYPSNPTTPQRLLGEFPVWTTPAMSPPTPPAPSPPQFALNAPRHQFQGKQMAMSPPTPPAPSPPQFALNAPRHQFQGKQMAFQVEHLWKPSELGRESATVNANMHANVRPNGHVDNLVDVPEETVVRDKNLKRDKTTMMLRNIPNKYTQKMLLKSLDSYGFRAKFDFFYLPIDFRNRCNVGYAFINFVAPEHAERFLKTLHRVKLPAYNSNKVCEVTYAHVQGLEENIEHYRNSPVNGVPIAAYRPLIFKGGLEIGFPKPDAPLPPIQLRPAKC